MKRLCTNVCFCVTLGEKGVARRRWQHRFTPAATHTLTQAPLDVNCLEDWQEGNVDTLWRYLNTTDSLVMRGTSFSADVRNLRLSFTESVEGY